jgi:hypothetical protein
MPDHYRIVLRQSGWVSEVYRNGELLQDVVAVKAESSIGGRGLSQITLTHEAIEAEIVTDDSGGEVKVLHAS